MIFRFWIPCFLALVCLPLAAATPASAGGTLRICLDQNIPPLSSKRENKVDGFDLAVAQAVASRLGRDVAIQWFESQSDKDSNPALEANALLSDGRCHLVAGFPLFASALGEPSAKRSRLPGHEGAKPEDRRRWVPLNAIVASRAYRFAPMVVVLGPRMASRRVNGLGDLKDLTVVSEEGTLSDTVLMSYSGGVLIDRITHVSPGPGLFNQIEQGDFDAALVELHRLDAYRAQHRDSKISSSGHYHSIGFNLGFVGLASEAPLVAEVNAAIGDMLAKQELPALAQATGLTYLPPRQPDVLTTITRAQLRGD